MLRSAPAFLPVPSLVVPPTLLAPLVAALLAGGCGGTVVFEEDGGEGGQGPTTSITSSTGNATANGGSGPVSSSSGPTSGVVTSTTQAVSVSSGGSGGICGSGVTLFSGTEDACLGDACCFEASSCESTFGADVCQACLDAGDGFECIEILKCARESGCWSGFEECQSGIRTGDPELDECLVEECCFDMLVCTQSGADVEACFACFEQGGGPRCDGAMRCVQDNCNGGRPPPDEGICDTGLSTGDGGVDQCLGDFCCGELHGCLDGGEEACIECLNSGGGPLCDETISCFDLNCGFDPDEG